MGLSPAGNGCPQAFQLRKDTQLVFLPGADMSIGTPSIRLWGALAGHSASLMLRRNSSVAFAAASVAGDVEVSTTWLCIQWKNV